MLPLTLLPLLLLPAAVAVAVAVGLALLLRWRRANSFLARTHATPRPPARRIGVVFAHPDDESMFFLPTLAHLRRHGHALHFLCLSAGNADGLGQQRCAELQRVAAILGVAEVRIVQDETNLPDGMRTRWPEEEVARHVERFVQQGKLDTLLTFDAWGVSGHANHRATYRGVCSYLRSHSSITSTPPLAYSLISTSFVRKYAGVLDAAFSWMEERRAEQKQRQRKQKRQATGSAAAASSALSPPDFAFIFSLNPLLSWRCMSTHASQFVWYRRLFVIFSRYAYCNTLQRIKL